MLKKADNSSRSRAKTQIESLGRSGQFDDGIGDFSLSSVDQAEGDHAAKAAVRKGKMIAHVGE